MPWYNYFKRLISCFLTFDLGYHYILQELFDGTMTLREKRQENEEQLAEEKKACELLKKEHDNLTKKLKAMDVALKAAQGDLEKFQVVILACPGLIFLLFAYKSSYQFIVLSLP